MISVGDHNAGAGGFGDLANTAPATPIEDAMAESIVVLLSRVAQLEAANEELTAETALLREERHLLVMRAARAETDAAAWKQEALDNLKQFSRERDNWRAAAAQAVADRDANKALADKFAEQLSKLEAGK